MKTLFIFCVAVGIAWLAFAPAAGKLRSSMVAGAASLAAAAKEMKTAEPTAGGKPVGAVSNDAVRKFEVTIVSVRPGGSAVAVGTYYDIPPSVTTSPERLSAAEGKWTAADNVFISGLPDGLIDNQTWTGWLSPAGTRSFTDARTGLHTVAAYQVAPPPPIVEYKRKPGSWMAEGGRTALDQRPH